MAANCFFAEQKHLGAMAVIALFLLRLYLSVC